MSLNYDPKFSVLWCVNNAKIHIYVDSKRHDDPLIAKLIGKGYRIQYIFGFSSEQLKNNEAAFPHRPLP